MIATSTASGFNVTVTGFTTTHELTQATFTLTPAPAAKLDSTTQTIGLTSAAAAYFAANSQYGGQFSFTVPFSISQGAKDVSSVSVVLTNSVGASIPVSVGVAQ